MNFQPYTQAFAADPYSVYAQLRADAPVFRSHEFGLTFFSRYADITTLLMDARLGRTMDHLLPAGEVRRRRSAEDWDRTPLLSRFVRVNLLETEGSDHERVRCLLQKAFSPLRIGRLRPRIQHLVDDLLAVVGKRPEMEFIADMATPLPVHVIAELLGWPIEDRHHLRPFSAAIIKLYEKGAGRADEDMAERTVAEFADMLERLVERRRREPRKDLISALVHVEDDGRRLTHDELIASCMLILNAGHEATVNAAGNGLLALLRHPRQLQALRRDPELINGAIEEILRYDSPLHCFHRYVLEDMECGGQRLRQGEMIALLYGSANRDDTVFADADTFDIRRQPNPHIAFGKGAHFCVGAALARLELSVMFNKLVQRLPQMCLRDEYPRYRTGLVFRGLESLRVRLSHE